MPIFPVSSLDPFADDFLAAPYPFYAELRDAGPVVWLERYGLWACARHAEVQTPPSLILEADPPLHTRNHVRAPPISDMASANNAIGRADEVIE
jgi:4-methoxybenzoate monooxygenase (O-demethylating)